MKCKESMTRNQQDDVIHINSSTVSSMGIEQYDAGCGDKEQGNMVPGVGIKSRAIWCRVWG